jgi:hypothetical protein
MVPINRKKVSLYEEAKNGLSSLVWQTTTVFVGFIFMLLLTGGNPSSFAIIVSFVSGIAFVVWREQNRFTKLRKDPDGSLDAIKKRMRPQKRNRDLRVIQVNGDGNSVVIGSYLDKRNNNLSVDIAKSIASNQSRYKNYIAVPTKIFTDQSLTGRTFKLYVAKSSDLSLSDSSSIDSNSADTVLKQVSASSTIKTRLFELRTAIIEHENLTDKSKADAIGYLEAIAEISLQENEAAS